MNAQNLCKSAKNQLRSLSLLVLHPHPKHNAGWFLRVAADRVVAPACLLCRGLGLLFKSVCLSAGNKNAASFATVIMQAQQTQQNSQGNEDIVWRRLKEKTGSLTVQSHKNHPKLTIIKVPLNMRSPFLKQTQWMGTTTRKDACFKCYGGVFKS